MFLDKNRDAVRTDLIELLGDSKSKVCEAYDFEIY